MHGLHLGHQKTKFIQSPKNLFTVSKGYSIIDLFQLPKNFSAAVEYISSEGKSS